MAGRGGGPSRRSHTKSRKGCKTCKRRHIRCDETFPQCRNCTKHQVRCDYMDMPPAVDDTLRINTQTGLNWTPEIERIVDHWRQNGQFPFADLEIYPPPQVKDMSRTETRLLYHVCDILTKLRQSRTSKLAMWTDIVPKCLNAAVHHPFVMHAIYAFSASHLAWETHSNDARSLVNDYVGLATRGLHEALLNFSKTNADAILATSILLSWLQNEWRNWASSISTLKTVFHIMQRFRPETIFEEYVSSQPIDPLQQFSNESNYPITNESRQESLKQIQNIQNALHRLQTTVQLPLDDPKLLDQMIVLIEAIRNSPVAQSPKEQFEQLYHLRKMLFWLPVNLLSARRGDLPTLLILAHFYAAALCLESVFPDVGAPFLSSLAASPLIEIINIIQTCQTQQAYDPLAQTAAMLMDFPRDALAQFRTRREWASQQASVTSPQQYGTEHLGIELASQLADQHAHTPSLSPAFASTAIHLTPPPISTQLPRSPFLEVPGSAVDVYGYKPFTPTSGSYQNTPTSAFAGSPLASPAIKQDVESPASVYQLPVPHFQGARGNVGYGVVNLSPMQQYAPSPSSGGYPGATSIAGGTGHIQQQPPQPHSRGPDYNTLQYPK